MGSRSLLAQVQSSGRASQVIDSSLQLVTFSDRRERALASDIEARFTQLAFSPQAQTAILRRFAQIYPAAFLICRVADTAPSRATMLGYGSAGRLHMHQGRLTGYATPTGDRTPDMAFSFGAESGDSGGGIFNGSGEFAGVLWGSSGNSGSMAVSTQKMHRFLNVQRTDLTPSAPGSSGKTVTISPFFFKIKRWNNAPQTPPEVIVQSPPAAPAPVEPPAPKPAPAVAAKNGADGKDGKDGAPGKDAPPTDLSAINAKLAALEASIGRAVTAAEGAGEHAAADHV